VILGVVSGAILCFFCVMALSRFLSFWAVPVGTISALAIWIVLVAINTVRMHFRGWNSVRIRFLAALGVIPCYTGIPMIIAMSIEGLG
jgi:hypothetical protein